MVTSKCFKNTREIISNLIKYYNQTNRIDLLFIQCLTEIDLSNELTNKRHYRTLNGQNTLLPEGFPGYYLILQYLLLNNEYFLHDIDTIKKILFNFEEYSVTGEVSVFPDTYTYNFIENLPPKYKEIFKVGMYRNKNSIYTISNTQMVAFFTELQRNQSAGYKRKSTKRKSSKKKSRKRKSTKRKSTKRKLCKN